MEETTSKAKEVKASEVTPWYVNQEVDKTVRKDRNPGALRNPSKRRKLLLPKPRAHREGDDDQKGDAEHKDDEDEGQVVREGREEGQVASNVQ